MLIIAFVLLFLAQHSFVSYPVSLWLVRKIGRRDIRPVASGAHPMISILCCCHNEQRTIKTKIENTLEAGRNYPGAFEILVFLDSCTDDTSRILTSFGDSVRVVDSETRSGKSLGMRQLVQLSKGELLAFTDANTLVAPDAVTQLAIPFGDPSIGGVSAQLSYLNSADTAVTQINGAYWRLEELTKRLESETGSMMGSDGAFFVIRRELYVPTPPDIIDDMHTSLNVVLQGRRLISWPKARAFEKTAAERADEFQRKIRIACRAFNCYRLLARKLHAQPAMTIYKFYSHKVLRWLTLPLALGGAAFLVAGLLRDGLSSAGLAVVAAAAIVMLLGWLGIRYFKMGFELMVSLLATFLGVIESMRGRRYQVWNSAPSGR